MDLASADLDEDKVIFIHFVLMFGSHCLPCGSSVLAFACKFLVLIMNAYVALSLISDEITVKGGSAECTANV